MAPTNLPRPFSVLPPVRWAPLSIEMKGSSSGQATNVARFSILAVYNHLYIELQRVPELTVPVEKGPFSVPLVISWSCRIEGVAPIGGKVHLIDESPPAVLSVPHHPASFSPSPTGFLARVNLPFACATLGSRKAHQNMK